MLLGLTLLVASCARSSHGGAERIAVLPFDNLTAEPALDWIESAAPAIVAEQLTGAAAVSPFRAQTEGDGYGARATRFVHGYFERRAGNLHFEMTLEDANSHKMVLNTAVNGDLLPAMNTIARTIDPTARAFSTSNPEAAAAWGQGNYERAISLDQDFSGAWVNWVQVRMGAGDLRGRSEDREQTLWRAPSARLSIARNSICWRPACARTKPGANRPWLLWQACFPTIPDWRGRWPISR